MRADSLEEALAALRRPGARPYAGGTDLLVRVGDAAESGIRELVDIKAIREATGIERVNGSMRIGALVTAANIAGDEAVLGFAPALVEAATQTSAPLLRARGTVGGNLVTRQPAADIATALLALEATVRVATTDGDIRRFPIAECPVFGSDALEPAFLILDVAISSGEGSSFRKIGARRAFSRARAAVAVRIRRGESRVALAGLTRHPFESAGVASALDAGANGIDALERDLASRPPAAAPDPVAIGLVLELIRDAHASAVRRSAGASA